jgi:hypothetical protein
MAFEAEVSKWFGDEQVRAKLGELRKTDPDKSLLARWELLPCGFLARFEQFFADRFHTSGGSLPIIWAELDETV